MNKNEIQEALEEMTRRRWFPEVRRQCCTVHLQRNVLTKAVGAFPGRACALRLITAVALHATAIWGDRRYLDVSLLEKKEADQAA